MEFIILSKEIHNLIYFLNLFLSYFSRSNFQDN